MSLGNAQAAKADPENRLLWILTPMNRSGELLWKADDQANQSRLFAAVQLVPCSRALATRRHRFHCDPNLPRLFEEQQDEAVSQRTRIVLLVDWAARFANRGQLARFG